MKLLDVENRVERYTVGKDFVTTYEIAWERLRRQDRSLQSAENSKPKGQPGRVLQVAWRPQ